MGKYLLQLPGHDGYIFLVAKQIEKSQTNKLHIIFLDEFHNFTFTCHHMHPPYYPVWHLAAYTKKASTNLEKLRFPPVERLCSDNSIILQK